MESGARELGGELADVIEPGVWRHRGCWSCALIGQKFATAGWKQCSDWSKFPNDLLKAVRWLVEFSQWPVESSALIGRIFSMDGMRILHSNKYMCLVCGFYIYNRWRVAASPLSLLYKTILKIIKTKKIFITFITTSCGPIVPRLRRDCWAVRDDRRSRRTSLASQGVDIVGGPRWHHKGMDCEGLDEDWMGCCCIYFTNETDTSSKIRSAFIRNHHRGPCWPSFPEVTGNCEQRLLAHRFNSYLNR